jgi:hypothetical protein
MTSQVNIGRSLLELLGLQQATEQVTARVEWKKMEKNYLQYYLSSGYLT